MDKEKALKNQGSEFREVIKIAVGGRNTNIEILRLFSMFLITALHFADHGITIWPSNIMIGRLITAMYAGGQVGVACFIMISGYCQRSTKHNWKKTILLVLQVCFYSVILEVCTQIIEASFNAGNIIKATFPILNNEYWFMSSYIGLILLMPYLNILMDSLTRSQFHTALIIGTLLFSIQSTFFTNTLWSNNLLWMIFVFSVGGYLTRFETTGALKKCTVPVAIIGYIIYVLALVFVAPMISSIGSKIGLSVFQTPNWLIGRYSVFTLAVATIIFISVINRKIMIISWINRYSKHLLSIYLLTMHRRFYPILWNLILWNDAAAENYTFMGFVAYFSLVMLFVFIACPLIDWIREKYVEKRIILKIWKI